MQITLQLRGLYRDKGSHYQASFNIGDARPSALCQSVSIHTINEWSAILGIPVDELQKYIKE